MSSSLDWVLSHWVHFTVHSLDLVVFICVYFVFFILHVYVVLLSAQWGGPNGIEAWSLGLLFLWCFDTVGWVFWPIKPVTDMTYNVFGGTLNLAQLNSHGRYQSYYLPCYLRRFLVQGRLHNSKIPSKQYQCLRDSAVIVGAKKSHWEILVKVASLWLFLLPRGVKDIPFGIFYGSLTRENCNRESTKCRKR